MQRRDRPRRAGLRPAGGSANPSFPRCRAGTCRLTARMSAGRDLDGIVNGGEGEDLALLWHRQGEVDRRIVASSHGRVVTTKVYPAPTPNLAVVMHRASAKPSEGQPRRVRNRRQEIGFGGGDCLRVARCVAGPAVNAVHASIDAQGARCVLRHPNLPRGSEAWYRGWRCREIGLESPGVTREYFVVVAGDVERPNPYAPLGVDRGEPLLGCGREDERFPEGVDGLLRGGRERILFGPGDGVETGECTGPSDQARVGAGDGHLNGIADGRHLHGVNAQWPPWCAGGGVVAWGSFVSPKGSPLVEGVDAGRSPEGPSAAP